MMHKTKEVLVSRRTTKKAILKRRLADRNRSFIRSHVVWMSPEKRIRLEVILPMLGRQSVALTTFFISENFNKITLPFGSLSVEFRKT
jgi:hypothetical protein